jgi:hypothetical protein
MQYGSQKSVNVSAMPSEIDYTHHYRRSDGARSGVHGRMSGRNYPIAQSHGSNRLYAL